MTLNERVLQIILDSPGTSRLALLERFALSDYRLTRVFRHIQRDLSGRRLVHHQENGVWIVAVDEVRCAGMDWVGPDNGGYVQCAADPEFPDSRCYYHTRYENPEMVAYKRRLAYLAGPAEPSAYSVSQLSMTVVEELLENLHAIEPMTHRDVLGKERLLKMVKASLAHLKWKDLMRRRNRQSWIPPGFDAHHRMSSGNTFEYSLKKCFLLLEVPVTADKEEVVKAWRKMAQRFHPDVEGGDEERMKAVNEAKERIFRMKRWE